MTMDSQSGFTNICFQIKHISEYFRPLEVVGRGDETQLQVGEDINYLIRRFKHVKGYVQIL